MIEKLKLWTGNIIVAVVISIVIDLILPSGNNRKYVKVITGLYILYVIINPILNLDEKIDLSKELKNMFLNETKIQTVSNDEIRKTYILSLENALKESIEKIGYSVENVKIYVSQDYSIFEKIEIKMKVGKKFDESKVKDLVVQNFEIDRENIFII